MKIKISLIKNEKEVSKEFSMKLMPENNNIDELKNTNPEMLESALCEFLEKSLHKALNKNTISEMLKELLQQ